MYFQNVLATSKCRHTKSPIIGASYHLKTAKTLEGKLKGF